VLSSESRVGEKLLPVWHKITADDLRELSPLLLDRYAIRTDEGVIRVANEILAVVRPNEKSVANGRRVLLPYYLDPIFADLFKAIGLSPIWANNKVDLLQRAIHNDFDFALEWQHGPRDFPIREMLRVIEKEVPLLLCLNWNGKIPEDFKELGYAGVLSVPFQVEELLAKTQLALPAKRRA
jgi:hypothetical protein